MSFSDNGECAWIRDQFPPDFMGYAADVGANDGMCGSNTLSLEYRGWVVLCIEPNPGYLQALTQWRQNFEIVACDEADAEDVDFHIHDTSWAEYSSLRPTLDNPDWQPKSNAQWRIVKVPVRRLDGLLEKHKFPHLDALSIDTEGTELQVLKGIDLKVWRPKVIVAESWNEETPITPYLAEFGYERVKRLQVNNCYLLRG